MAAPAELVFATYVDVEHWPYRTWPGREDDLADEVLAFAGWRSSPDRLATRPGR